MFRTSLLALKHGNKVSAELFQRKRNNIESLFYISLSVPDTVTERFGGVGINSYCEEKTINRLIIIQDSIGHMAAYRFALHSFLP